MNQKQTLKLNCDMGESFGAWRMGNDETVMPYIDMANIACGFHASDPDVMAHTIKLAKQHNVRIGAHPSYPDLVGFGRRSMHIEPYSLINLIIYQVGALQALCHVHDTQVSYIKPHGALYNDMMRDPAIFESVAIAAHTLSLPLMVLAQGENKLQRKIADTYKIDLIFEAFVDRLYCPDGSLAPRNQEHAVHRDTKTILSQAYDIAHSQQVVSSSGERISIEASTLCVHGDNESALALVKQIRQTVNLNNEQS